jgi:CMP-N-acetylneuraminic acid synthetase
MYSVPVGHQSFGVPCCFHLQVEDLTLIGFISVASVNYFLCHEVMISVDGKLFLQEAKKLGKMIM